MVTSHMDVPSKCGIAGAPSGVSLYLDFYGALLTDKQAEILDLYYNDDYSLSEIARALGVSRQAAHDALKGGTQALAGYEGKLGLVRAYQGELRAASEAREAIAELRAAISRIKETVADDDAVMGSQLDSLVDIARRIEQYIQKDII
ncbi:MAG: putative DNA-binding protein [Oscillospiraceae bacterium]|nr:putative DNA-binding protein [Oscillospiraceae bacterium]